MSSRMTRKRSQSALHGHDRIKSLQTKFLQFTGSFHLLSARRNRLSTLFVGEGAVRNYLLVENDAMRSGIHRICYCLQEDVVKEPLGIFKLTAYRELETYSVTVISTYYSCFETRVRCDFRFCWNFYILES
jgi:hypothetical protein